MRTRLLAVAGATFLATTSQADILRLGLDGLPLLPFGGETLLAFIGRGEITSVEVDLTFETGGEFRSENLAFTLFGPTGGVTRFAATDFGWFGQGTFTTSFTTDAFDGFLGSEASFTTWGLNIAPVVSSFPTPLEGALLEPSELRIHLIACADENGDFVVDTADLLSYLAMWFAGDADRTGDGVTDVNDLLEFLSDWFDPCACNPC